MKGTVGRVTVIDGDSGIGAMWGGDEGGTEGECAWKGVL